MTLRIIYRSLALLFSAVALALVVLWAGVTWYPAQSSAEVHCVASAEFPENSPQSLTVMSYNVQYMAGKNYVFFYDAPDGPDTRPSVSDIAMTIDQVAEVISQYRPDLVLIQEILGEGDVRGHYQDQLRPLLAAIGENEYPCYSQASYWDAKFIPHPKIMGGVEMNLVTLSRWPMISAMRTQLPYLKQDLLNRRFYFQRAVLASEVNWQGQKLTVLNTHFDAWGGGSGIMEQQVGRLIEIIDDLEKKGTPWLAGGDLNLLPPDGGKQRQWLISKGVEEYGVEVPIESLYQQFNAVPLLADVKGLSASEWFTFNPNNPGPYRA